MPNPRNAHARRLLDWEPVSEKERRRKNLQRSGIRPAEGWSGRFPTDHPLVRSGDVTENVRLSSIEDDRGNGYAIPTMINGVQLEGWAARKIAEENGLENYPRFPGGSKDAERFIAEQHGNFDERGRWTALDPPRRGVGQQVMQQLSATDPNYGLFDEEGNPFLRGPFARGFMGGSAHLERIAASGLEALPFESGGLLKGARENLRARSGAVQDWYARTQPREGEYSIADHISEFAGTTVPTLAMYAATTTTTGPIAGFAIPGLLDRDEGADLNWAEGGKGAVLGGYFRAVQPYNRAVSAVIVGALEGKLHPPETSSGKPPETAKEWISYLTGPGVMGIFAALGKPHKGGSALGPLFDGIQREGFRFNPNAHKTHPSELRNMSREELKTHTDSLDIHAQNIDGALKNNPEMVNDPAWVRFMDQVIAGHKEARREIERRGEAAGGPSGQPDAPGSAGRRSPEGEQPGSQEPSPPATPGVMDRVSEGEIRDLELRRLAESDPEYWQEPGTEPTARDIEGLELRKKAESDPAYWNRERREARDERGEETALDARSRAQEVERLAKDIEKIRDMDRSQDNGDGTYPHFEAIGGVEKFRQDGETYVRSDVWDVVGQYFEGIKAKDNPLTGVVKVYDSRPHPNSGKRMDRRKSGPGMSGERGRSKTDWDEIGEVGKVEVQLGDDVVKYDLNKREELDVFLDALHREHMRGGQRSEETRRLMEEADHINRWSDEAGVNIYDDNLAPRAVAADLVSHMRGKATQRAEETPRRVGSEPNEIFVELTNKETKTKGSYDTNVAGETDLAHLEAVRWDPTDKQGRGLFRVFDADGSPVDVWVPLGRKSGRAPNQKFELPMEEAAQRAAEAAYENRPPPVAFTEKPAASSKFQVERIDNGWYEIDYEGRHFRIESSERREEMGPRTWALFEHEWEILDFQHMPNKTPEAGWYPPGNDSGYWAHFRTLKDAKEAIRQEVDKSKAKEQLAERPEAEDSRGIYERVMSDDKPTREAPAPDLDISDYTPRAEAPAEPWQMTAREFFHPTFNRGAIDRFEAASQGEIVGTIGDFIKGRLTREALGEVLDVPVMRLDTPVQGGKRADLPEGVEFKGASGTFDGNPTVFIKKTGDFLTTLYEEAAHQMRVSRGRPMTKQDITSIDLDAYKGLPEEVSAERFVAYLKKLGEREAGHRELVERALAEGKPVPPEVLAEYPDLAPTPRAEAPKSLPKAETKFSQEGMEELVKEKGLDFGHDIWSNVKTGEGVELDVHRGSGREDAASVYAPDAEGPALGEGRYSAMDRSAAEKFGPDVESSTVRLENPYVLESDGQLKELAQAQGGGPVLPMEVAEWVPVLKKVRAEIESRGHDGVIVNVRQYRDFDEAAGIDNVKRLREVFGDSQVIEFPRAEAEQRPPAPPPEAQAAEPPRPPPTEAGAEGPPEAPPPPPPPGGTPPPGEPPPPGGGPPGEPPGGGRRPPPGAGGAAREAAEELLIEQQSDGMLDLDQAGVAEAMNIPQAAVEALERLEIAGEMSIGSNRPAPETLEQLVSLGLMDAEGNLTARGEVALRARQKKFQAGKEIIHSGEQLDMGLQSEFVQLGRLQTIENTIRPTSNWRELGDEDMNHFGTDDADNMSSDDFERSSKFAQQERKAFDDKRAGKFTRDMRSEWEKKLSRPLRKEMQKVLIQVIKDQGFVYEEGGRSLRSQFTELLRSGLLPDGTLREIADRHGWTPQDMLQIWGLDSSEAGKTLQELKVIADYMKKEGIRVTEEGGELKPEDIGMDPGSIGTRANRYIMNLENVRRGLLVSQISTMMRNMETQLVNQGIHSFEARLDHVIKYMFDNAGMHEFAAKIQPARAGEAFSNSMDNLVTGVMSLGTKQGKAMEKTQLYLSRFPKEYAEMFSTYMSDISAHPEMMTPALIQMQKVANLFNTFNRWQEFSIRSGVFNAELGRVVELDAKFAEEMGVEPGTVTLQWLENNNRLSQIPRKHVKAAVQKSLEATWAMDFKSPRPGRPGYRWTGKLLEILRLGPTTIAIPFPRFMANSIKWQLERNPLSVLRYMSENQRQAFRDGDVSGISKWITGNILFGIAYGLRDSDYAGSSWEKAKAGETPAAVLGIEEGAEISFLPYSPMAGMLFWAEYLKQGADEGIYAMSLSDIVKALTSSQLRAGLGLHSLDSYIEDTATRHGDMDKVLSGAGEALGVYAQGFLTPLKQMSDVAKAMDKDLAKVRMVSGNDFAGNLWGSATRNIPWAVEGYPEQETLLPIGIPPEERSVSTYAPGLKLLTGILASAPLNALQEQAKEVHFTANEMIQGSGNRKWDNLLKKYATVHLLPLARAIENNSVWFGDTKWNDMSPEARHAEIKNQMRSAVETARLEAMDTHPDLYAEMMEGREPKRTRELRESIEEHQLDAPPVEETHRPSFYDLTDEQIEALY